jgi:prepilin-type N-terminal cleavage/methylation domain-containing protein
MFINKKEEKAFSLLELSVAVGVAAIVAVAGIVATTAFIGSAQEKRDNYTSNANTSIEAAESASAALGLPGGGAGGGGEGEATWTSGAPTYNVTWNGSSASFIFALGTCDNDVKLQAEYYNGTSWVTHVNQVSGLTSEGGAGMCATGVDRYNWDALGGTAAWDLSDQSFVSLGNPFEARYRLVNTSGEYTQWYSLGTNFDTSNNQGLGN